MNILKALAGTTWGHQKETLSLTYNSLIKPILTYAAPIWFPSICITNRDHLQTVQNKALRVITGSHLQASEGHLHAETHILPIADHLDMLCAQFLASSLRETHPSHHYVTLPPGPRTGTRIPTLHSKYFGQINHLLTNGKTPTDQYSDIIRDIHASTVTNFVINQPDNRVLSAPPPDVSGDEGRLPRHYRTTLSQLRSGRCARLRDYQLRVGWSSEDTCPECAGAVHTVEHLFECPACPTPLTPRDLWLRPVEVATFLRGMSAFAELPPLEPPSPPPPPEPPPA